MDDKCMYLRSICVDRGHALWTEATHCGPRPHVVDRGTRVMHRLWVQWQNIRRVVAGAREWSYEAQRGAMGCDGFGVT